MSRFGGFCQIFVMLVGWAFLPCHAYSSPDSISVGSDGVVFDSSHEMDWAEAYSADEDPMTIADSRWKRSKGLPNVGPGRQTVWYRMILINDTPSKASFAFVSMDSVVSALVELMALTANGKMEKVTIGTSVPKSQWPVKAHLLVLPFTLDPGIPTTVYFGISSLYSRNLLYQVQPEASWRRYISKSVLFFGFYFGVISLVLLVNLIAFSATREPVTLAYAAMSLATLVASSLGMGFIGYFLPDHPLMTLDFAETVMVPVCLCTISWLAREYLELRLWSKFFWWYYTAMIFICMTTVLVALSGTQLRNIQTFNDAIITITSVVGICASAYGVIRNKTPYAASFLVGLGAYTIGGVLWTKQFTALIPTTWWSVHALFVGQITQNLVFSFTVVRQLRAKMVVSTISRESSRYGERMGHLVRVLTHDLSNYISIIDGSAMALARNDLSEDIVNRQIAKMKKALNQQREVLDSIKELKALEDGKAELQLEKVDVGTMLADLNATFEGRLAQKVVRLEVAPVAPGEIQVWADRKTLFHSVLCNLVSNAIKFSEPLGVIVVGVNVGDEKVGIFVTDSGIGIPEDLVARLFMSNEKTSRVGTGGEAGTGFGLPISKAYMDVYGGSISVLSKPKDAFPVGHGTTFTLTFKRAR